MLRKTTADISMRRPLSPSLRMDVAVERTRLKDYRQLAGVKAWL